MPEISLNLKRWAMVLGIAGCVLHSVPVTAQETGKSTPSQSRSGENGQRAASRGGVAETAPASGGYAATGGTTNVLGDPKGNRAGIPPGEETRAQGKSAISNGKPRLGIADRTLMRELAQAHLAEVKMSALATAISRNDAIRSYAEKMLEEHLKALDELKMIAAENQVILPGGVEMEQAALLGKLAVLAGEEFNQLYMAQAGLASHQQAHQLFREAGSRAQAPELKAYAATLVPVIEQHLQLAQKMQENPGLALKAVQETVMAGQSTSTRALSGASSNQADNNSAVRGSSSLAGSAVDLRK